MSNCDQTQGALAAQIVYLETLVYLLYFDGEHIKEATAKDIWQDTYTMRRGQIEARKKELVALIEEKRPNFSQQPSFRAMMSLATEKEKGPAGPLDED